LFYFRPTLLLNPAAAAAAATARFVAIGMVVESAEGVRWDEDRNLKFDVLKEMGGLM